MLKPSPARALASFAAILLAGCATAPRERAREPWLLTTESLPDPPVREIRRISTYPQALSTTLDVMQHDLGLPPVQVQLVFIPDTRRMGEMLRRAGYPPALARQAVRELTAIGGGRTVLINQTRLEREDWPGRVSILAHELGHVLQYELGSGTRETSVQWLREGFSRWLEQRVLERLAGADVAVTWNRSLQVVRNPPGSQVMALDGPLSPARRIERGANVRLPPLRELRTFPQWTRQLRGPAGRALYDYAFVAVSVLVEDHGLPAVLCYFELFAAEADPAVNFREAFGFSEEQFERRLRRVVRP